VRGAPLKDFGSVAAEMACFNRQCDCFVTKHLRWTERSHEPVVKTVNMKERGAIKRHKAQN